MAEGGHATCGCCAVKTPILFLIAAFAGCTAPMQDGMGLHGYTLSAVVGIAEFADHASLAEIELVAAELGWRKTTERVREDSWSAEFANEIATLRVAGHAEGWDLSRTYEVNISAEPEFATSYEAESRVQELWPGYASDFRTVVLAFEREGGWTAREIRASGLMMIG